MIIAGGTAGVLDAQGSTIAQLDAGRDRRDDRDPATRTRAWSRSSPPAARALDGGVADVAIVSGRGVPDFDERDGTRIARARRDAGARSAVSAEAR